MEKKATRYHTAHNMYLLNEGKIRMNGLTLVLLVANFANTKCSKKTEK